MIETQTLDAGSKPTAGKGRSESHWRSKTKRQPFEHDRALRQGRISHCAFDALGREHAIAFLNTDNTRLGGQPLAIATASVDGEEMVAREIERLRSALPGPPATTTAQDVP